MYCAFAVTVASVCRRSAPLPAGAVGSTTKLTVPPGRVSAVDQPCVLVGVTTPVEAATAAETPTNSAAARMQPVMRNLMCAPPVCKTESGNLTDLCAQRHEVLSRACAIAGKCDRFVPGQGLGDEAAEDERADPGG